MSSHRCYDELVCEGARHGATMAPALVIGLVLLVLLVLIVFAHVHAEGGIRQGRRWGRSRVVRRTRWRRGKK